MTSTESIDCQNVRYRSNCQQYHGKCLLNRLTENYFLSPDLQKLFLSLVANIPLNIYSPKFWYLIFFRLCTMKDTTKRMLRYWDTYKVISSGLNMIVFLSVCLYVCLFVCLFVCFGFTIKPVLTSFSDYFLYHNQTWRPMTFRHNVCDQNVSKIFCTHRSNQRPSDWQSNAISTQLARWAISIWTPSISSVYFLTNIQHFMFLLESMLVSVSMGCISSINTTLNMERDHYPVLFRVYNFKKDMPSCNRHFC